MSGVDVRRLSEAGPARVGHVDWKLAAGEYWVVGGPSDSGKTELLQTAAGLQQPGRGSVRLFGQDVAVLPEPELLQLRTRVGFVFKGGGRLFTEMTVAENIALPLRYHRNLGADEALEAVHALLRLTDLSDAGSESPQRLPGGMRQRVGLARALALQPEIVFLDEPLAGLGWRHRQWWLDFLQQLSEGKAYNDARKVAVAVTTNDFAPWSGRSASFALVRERRWETLGPQKELPNI
jgi:phospholipid/cholesterol/gamma-HCH transport system ATP-binding protein